MALLVLHGQACRRTLVRAGRADLTSLSGSKLIRQHLLDGAVQGARRPAESLARLRPHPSTGISLDRILISLLSVLCTGHLSAMSISRCRTVSGRSPFIEISRV